MPGDPSDRRFLLRNFIALAALGIAVAVWAYARRDMSRGVLPSLSDPMDPSLGEQRFSKVEQTATFGTGSGGGAATPPFEFRRSWTYAAGLGEESQWAGLKSLVGKRAPNLSVAQWSVGANPAPPPDSLDGKVVLIDFWATWCGPCKAAIPQTNAVAEKFRDRGVVVLGVCATRGSDTMTQTAQRHGMKYASARDLDNATAGAFGVQWFPFYVLVDRQGIIRAAGLTPSAISPAVEALLAAESTPG